jgi:hypothetical protein
VHEGLRHAGVASAHHQPRQLQQHLQQAGVVGAQRSLHQPGHQQLGVLAELLQQPGARLQHVA